MELNKENIQKIVGIIAFGVGFYWLLNNLDGVGSFIHRFFRLLFPFILGGIIAFILNIPMTNIANLLYILDIRNGKGERFTFRFGQFLLL